MAKKSKTVIVAFKLTFDHLGNAQVAAGIDSILGAYETEEAAEAAVLKEYKENNLNKYSYTVKNLVQLEIEK